ncbi:hypothetical protein [Bradyrhizobium sp.]|uniref:hypothetical protein n=1 Tax=Bradyrhizobium sp. TaxID=376 RepID=UPI0025BEDD9C|nr:hypothetical protein [Bradyrhizobium sp.]
MLRQLFSIATATATIVIATVTMADSSERRRIYIVDRGPVYSGPGIYTKPTIARPRRLPDYPYVGPVHFRALPSYRL